VDLLITGGTVITMDAGRRVIEDGAVAVAKDRIVAVGASGDLKSRFAPRRTIDAARKVVMPGLIDGHGHAGHGLLKSPGTDMPGEWYRACERIYAEGSTEWFWRGDALLTAVERLRFGETTGLAFFGGGDSVMRTDELRYGDAHLSAVEQVGVRWILAVGPRRPPFPRRYVRWDGDRPEDVRVSFDDQLRVSEALIQRWHGKGGGRLHIAMMFPTHHPGPTPRSAGHTWNTCWRFQIASGGSRVAYRTGSNGARASGSVAPEG
jgi:cytosine/adenosine deaminase-related metal-dependent hydrolase